MTSMRTLNRRLQRWRRYARRTGPDTVMAAGHLRAFNAVQAERERRDRRAYNPFPNGQCVCGGCVGMGPCEYERPGLSAWWCDWDEPGDDEWCENCNGVCCHGCDDESDSAPWPPGVVTVDTGGLT